MSDPSTENKIAVVGRAGRFPAARTVDELWDMLAKGRVAATKRTDADLLAAGVSRNQLADPNYVKVANILPDMECFDAGFFGFSPREASILDPQHRHFLETSWEALEDAAIMPDGFEGQVGVFAGSGMQAYLPFNLLSNKKLVEEIGMFLLRHTGNDKDFMPTRLSYLLNLTGPSVAVQTACSTSLVAVHMAANSLLNFESDMAIAGGVTIELPHRVGYTFRENEILSPDGLCRAFDEHSQGTVFGSGAAILVLRRLEDALEDGDDVKAVILGSAVNNDGSQKASYLAPSVDGQAEAAAEAVAIAGVEPATISYIEAHGTGTPIGDPIELSALQEVYADADKGSVGIGSIKTNIGHLDTAAGAASLIKVIEAARHKTLPASLNFETPNSKFDFANGAFRVVTETQPWSTNGHPRRAAVNSLGVGGTNAHVVIEEAPETALPKADDDQWRVYQFSTRTDQAMENTKAKWSAYLQGESAPLADIAHTLRTGRRAFGERMTIAARSKDDLREKLTAKVDGCVARGSAAEVPPKVVFLFPGGGAQYPGAGTEMMEQSAVFKAAVEECFDNLPSSAPDDLRATMFDSTRDDADAVDRIRRSRYAIPALFILEYAYTQVLESWGITPDSVVAHSVGEYAAAVAAGALSVADGMHVVTRRGEAMEAAPEGAMTMLPVDEATSRDIIGDTLDIAAVNTAAATVVSGPLDEIEKLEQRLRGTEHEARRIHIDVAAHSRQLDGQLETFRDAFADVSFGELSIPMISSTRGDWATDDDVVSTDYWVRHLRGTVRFADAIAASLAEPNQIVIEVGPGQTLRPLVASAEVPSPAKAVLSVAPRPVDSADEMGVALAVPGGMWAAGIDIDWEPVVDTGGRRVSIPTYAFEKNAHWVEPGTSTDDPSTTDSDEAVAIVRRESLSDWFEQVEWSASSAESLPLSTEPVLLFAGDDPVSLAVVEQLKGNEVPTLIVTQAAAFASTAAGFELNPGNGADFERLTEEIDEVPQRILYLWDAAPSGAERSGFGAAYLFARSLQLADVADGTNVVFAARNSIRLADESDFDPAGALLLGIVRTAPREIEGLATALVDIDASDDAEVVAGNLLGELERTGQGDYVAWRGATRFHRQRSALPVDATAGLPARLRSGGVYFITGGTGGIGREMARWLAQVANGRVVLVSRSGSDDEALRHAIRDAGGELLTVQGDVTDIASLQHAVDQTVERFGEINAVIHAAGVINDAPLSVKPVEETAAVIDPKLDGAHNLSEMFPDESLDFFAVISSSSVELGPAGQTDYVGANAAIEAIARSRRDGYSVSWGVWSDVGMAAQSYGLGQVGTATTASPVIGSRADLDDGAITFVNVIDPRESWVVAEHVVGGTPVLPGTAFLELAQTAAAEVLQGRGFDLRDVSMMIPMTFEAGLARIVTVRLIPDGADYELSIESSLGIDAPAETHATATVQPAKGPGLELASTLALSTGPEWTERAAAQGGEHITFGPRWDNVERVHSDGTGVVAEFSLPEHFHGDLTDHSLHPGLLDMAATIGLSSLDEGARSGLVYAPMSIDRMTVLGPLPARVRSRALRTNENHRQFVSFDVVITDIDDNPVVLIERLGMRAIENGQMRPTERRFSLVDELLATGIRASEAPEFFSLIFNTTTPSVVASPVSLDAVRIAMLPAPKAKTVATRGPRSDGPTNPVQQQIAEIWEDILGVADIGGEDDFFDLGGHSLNAVRMFARLRKVFDVNLPIDTLFEASTVATLADLVADEAGLDQTPVQGDSATDDVQPGESATANAASTPKRKREWSPLVRISAGDPDTVPLYCVHGAGGNILNFRALAGYLDPSIPFYALRALGSDGGLEMDTTIDAMGERYFEAILKHQPEGPYRLSGYSGGGVIAFDIAQRLVAIGKKVEHVVFFDSLAAHVATEPLSILQKLWAARKWSLSFALDLKNRRKISDEMMVPAEEVEARLAQGEVLAPEMLGARMERAYYVAQTKYQAKPYDGSIVIYRARHASTMFLAAGERLGWDDYLNGPVESIRVDCDHFSMMDEPAIAEIGQDLSRRLLDD